MSTRCQVIVKDSYSQVWFYRHCDGYPEGVKESLQTFLDYVKSKKIRENAMQSAGWLVIIGHNEYGIKDVPEDWNVGSYEPCEPQKYGDIEYLYTVDINSKQVYYFDGNKKIVICE